MEFASIKDFIVQVALVTPEQFEEWNKAWRVAMENGSQESLLAFICRERGVAEDAFPATACNRVELALSRSAKSRRSTRGAQKDFHQSRFSIFRPADSV